MALPYWQPPPPEPEEAAAKGFDGIPRSPTVILDASDAFGDNLQWKHFYNEWLQKCKRAGKRARVRMASRVCLSRVG
jgi:hypothetical protein